MTIDLQIGRLIAAFNCVSCWVQMMIGQGNNLQMGVPVRSFAELKDHVTALVEISANCDFAVINVAAKEAAEELAPLHPDANGNVVIAGETFVRVRGKMGRLKDITIAESQTRFALILDAHSRELWEPTKAPFGDDFKNKFQASQYDLDEAGKSLALGRGTAAVFHVMRIMETGLRAVHNCLGLTAPFANNDRSWGAILKRIRDDGITPRGGPKKWAEHDLFQEMYARLDAVKDAWRNPTMHVEIKYTPDEATYVFSTARGFMSKLASRMDENGEPKA